MATDPLAEEREVLRRLRPQAPAPPPGVDPTLDPVTPNEREVLRLLNTTGATAEKVDFLLADAVMRERVAQRDDDERTDHGIRLMSRQKFQTWKRVIFVFLFLNWIYGVQLVVEYNLGHSVGLVSVDLMVAWVERGEWSNPSLGGALATNDSSVLDLAVRTSFGGTVVKYDQLFNLGWCLTPTGKFEAAFNVATGLVICYLFIFGDLFNVVFTMPLVRSFPNEPRGKFMLFANVWIVSLNGVVLTWLGVIAGESVNGNASNFFAIINTALSVFIVVAIDNQVLSAIRFVAEEAGYMDYRGVMSDSQLDRLTFGNQYYKPGYGHNWIHKLRYSPLIIKFISIFLLLSTIAIVITPGAIIASRAWRFLVPCA